MSTDWFAHKTKGGETLFLYNVKTGEHRWQGGCMENQMNDGNYVTDLLQFGSQWCEYKCKSGQTLFYFNRQTGEHKWDLYSDSPLSTIPGDPVYLNKCNSSKEQNTSDRTDIKPRVSVRCQDSNTNGISSQQVTDHSEWSYSITNHDELLQNNPNPRTTLTEIESNESLTSINSYHGTSVADLISQELRNKVSNGSEGAVLRTKLRTRELNTINYTTNDFESELSDEEKMSCVSSSSDDDNCSNFSDELNDLSESDSDDEELCFEKRNQKRESADSKNTTAKQQRGTKAPTLSIVQQPSIPSIPPPQLSPNYADTYQEGHVDNPPGGASHGLLSDTNKNKRHLEVRENPIVLSSSANFVITSCFSLSKQGVQSNPVSPCLNNNSTLQPMTGAQTDITPMHQADQQQRLPSYQPVSCARANQSGRTIRIGNVDYPVGQIVRKALQSSLTTKQTPQNRSNGSRCNDTNAIQPLHRKSDHVSLENIKQLILAKQLEKDKSTLPLTNNSSINIHPPGCKETRYPNPTQSNGTNWTQVIPTIALPKTQEDILAENDGPLRSVHDDHQGLDISPEAEPTYWTAPPSAIVKSEFHCPGKDKQLGGGTAPVNSLLCTDEVDDHTHTFDKYILKQPVRAAQPTQPSQGNATQLMDEGNHWNSSNHANTVPDKPRLSLQMQEKPVAMDKTANSEGILSKENTKAMNLAGVRLDSLRSESSVDVCLESSNNQSENSYLIQTDARQIIANNKEMVNSSSNPSNNIINEAKTNSSSSISTCLSIIAETSAGPPLAHSAQDALHHRKDQSRTTRPEVAISSSRPSATRSPVHSITSSLLSICSLPTMVTGLTRNNVCDVILESKNSLLTLAHVQSHQAGDSFVHKQVSTSKTKMFEIFDRIIRCYYCTKNFQTCQELQRHLVIRHCHFGGMFKCHMCSDSFYSKEEFSFHASMCSKETMIMCKRCKQTFESVDLLGEHMSSHVNDNKPNSNHFPDQGQGLELHNGDRDINDNPGNQLNMIPKQGDTSDSNKADSQAAAFEKPNYLLDQRRGEDHPGQSREEQGDVRKRKCKHCEKTFNHFFAWRLHMKTHKEVDIFSCKLCPNWYLRIRALSQHVVTHLREKKAKCNVCARVFRSYKDFLQHRKAANCKYKLFRCMKKACRTVFYNWDVYHKHLVTVHVIAFTCETCGKSFARKEKLRDHVRLHTGDKPKECEVCGRHFRTKMLLQNHRKTHSNEKPLKCKVCDKRFKQKSAILRHERSHMQNLRDHCCDICGKVFTQACSLQRHNRIHTGERFKCPKCPMKYIEAWRMRIHVKNKHPNDEMED